MTIFIVIFIIIIMTVVEIARETRTFRVISYTVSSPKLEQLKTKKKLVFLSDLHNQSYGVENIELFNAVQRAKPDMILIGGDMVVAKSDVSDRPALSFIKKLSAVCPVYYALGNHEQRRKEHPECYGESFDLYKRELESTGVQFLENSQIDIETEDLVLSVCGLEIPERCYERFHKEEIQSREIQQRIGMCDKSKYHVLLAHNPLYAKEYMEWGADMILSGHLHGGIVRIPGITGVIAPNFSIFPKYSGGHYREGGTDIIVSRGLGTHTVRIRLFNPAEMVVITLCSQKACETLRHPV